jgi:signal transduction histidine kinase/ActR/RegA family two-component response regulator
MLDGVRQRMSRWMGRPAATETPAYPLIFADHAEIRDIAQQLSRTKVELDRSVRGLRGWARDLSRRLGETPAQVEQGVDLRALGETVGGLAHNFNNSLAAILAYTELLLKEVQTDTAQRRLKVIRDVALEASVSVRRFQELVSREPQVAFGPVGLPGVVNEALAITAPRWRDEAERRGIVINVVQDLESVPPVEGNSFELRDALINLIQNAVSAMPQGGTVTIRASSEESGWVAVEIHDTGVGMPEALRRGLTDRSLESSTDERARGLAQVLDIVERHGGGLGVDAAEGRGTTVRMRLHASRFQIIPPSPGTVEALEPDQAVRVLLVDDDQRLVTVLSDMLREGGHAVTTATTGEEAISLFDPAAHDVVITDLGMPKMNGWEVAERVKTAAPATRVFVLTGWGESVAPDEKSRFVDQIIAKPISADALLGELAGLSRVRATRR